MHAFTTDAFTVFATASTPVTQLPNGIFILGHAFTHTGKPVDIGVFPTGFKSDKEARRRIIEECWGEYLVIQKSRDNYEPSKLMRDPSGGVECFFSLTGNGPGFITSDISIAVDLGIYEKEVDWGFIQSYLRRPNTKTGTTGLLGIRELLPGHLLSWGNGRSENQEIWSPWTFLSEDRRHRCQQEAKFELRETVRRVVGAWAEVDKTVLMELSGGLDSSILASCLAHTDAKVACCTVTTPVPGADERRYASQLTQHLGMDLSGHTLSFDNARYDPHPPAGAVMPCIGPLQHAVDGIMEAEAIAHGARSHFSGAGGDTVLGFCSNASPVLSSFRDRGLRGGLSTIDDVATLHRCTAWKVGRLALKKMRNRGNRLPNADTSFIQIKGEGAQIPDLHPWLSSAHPTLPGDYERIRDLSGTQVFRDDAPRGKRRYLRMPFLSQPVMETCLRTPLWMQVSGGEDRSIARQAFSLDLPEGIRRRRSKGTFVSYSGCIYERNRTGILKYLSAGMLNDKSLLDMGALSRHLSSTSAPKDQQFLRILELCMIESWVRNQR